MDYDYHFFATPSQAGIQRATRDAKVAKNEAHDAASQVQAVRESFDKLALITKALWEILKKETGKTDADLEAMVKEIDLRDGQLDGKLPVEVKRCHRCSRPLNRRHQRCLYCGSEALEADVFQTL